MTIDATNLVGAGFPPDEGVKLAKAILRDRVSLTSATVIDLRRLPVEMLISPFFNAFLQTLFEEDRALLQLARQVKFEVEFDFQRENIRAWLAEFKPYEGAALRN